MGNMRSPDHVYGYCHNHCQCMPEPYSLTANNWQIEFQKLNNELSMLRQSLDLINKRLENLEGNIK